MTRLAYYRADLVTPTTEQLDADLCIYGGSSAGVIAAVQAVRLGLRAVVLEPGDHLGGLSAGGLGQTDTGKPDAIGGLAREFYQRVGRHYGEPIEWKFEPHVAAAVFADLVREHAVTVRKRQYLDRVERDGARLTAIHLRGGLRVTARQFIDATYEGDLMAMAGVLSTVGREANSLYGETLNGVQVHQKHQFAQRVDPYVRPGDPASGLLPGLDPAPLGPTGSGDTRLQAFNFRMCLTDDPAIRVAFTRPEGYDPAAYELLARTIQAGWTDIAEMQTMYIRLRNHAKTDTNNHGPVSTDFIGQNHAWATAGYEERERIFQAHVAWQRGLHYFLANDPRVPAAMRASFANWGLAGDEFQGTGHWPHQLYIREARRMIADYVVTEHDCRATRRAGDSVGLGSYNMDSHNCRRFVRDGAVMNEGDVQVPPTAPYPIPMRAVVPTRGQCDNLVVPVCCSCSHIAYGSLRMEPVFMILGQSAATIAALALRRGCAVQDVPYAELRERLVADGQVLAWEKGEQVRAAAG
jgi:hypothetical protein